MQVHRFSVGPLDNNTYVVVDDPGTSAVVVDPGFGSESVVPVIEQNGWSIAEILLTHAHIDHVAQNAHFAERFRAPLVMHHADLVLLNSLPEQAAWMGVDVPVCCRPERFIVDSDEVRIGTESLRVVHTPGHSPGSVSLLGPGFTIVGDVLFAGSIGRTDLPGGDMAQLLTSIQTRLLSLPDDTVVYPGHGPETTIGRERSKNPFLNQS